MALATLRNPAVFLGMTGGAFQFGVLAGFFLQACRHFTMTDPALAFELSRYGDTHQGLVRILVTVKALEHRFCLTVGRIMATATFGHDLRIVVLQGIIGMKDFMAFHAEHTTVFCAIILDPVELRDVTPSAIRNRKRFDLHIIYIICHSWSDQQSPQQEGYTRHADNGNPQSFVHEHFLASSPIA